MDAGLKDFAHQLADASGAVIQKYFRKVGFEDKADASPVTIADREAEEEIRKLIERYRPDDAIWGEEYGVKDGISGYRWILDPIDGTLPFTAGRPSFATIIGLEYQGKNLLGVIDQPITNDRWIGVVGGHSELNGQRAMVSDKKEMKHALLACTTINRMTDDEFAGFRRCQRIAKNTLFGGDAYGYGLLASGWIDVIAETGLKLHDYAGLVPVIEAAGGIITDWQGNSLAGVEKSNVLAAATPELHQAAIELLNQA